MYQLEKYVHCLPRPVVRWLRDRYLATLDFKDRVLRHGNDLTPPRSLYYIGGGDFHTIGNTFVNHFIEVCGLQRDEAVLDIGCGTGRMAIPLLDYLTPEGTYLGFDISRKAIRWCKEHIGPRNQRFSFVYADIHNKDYNPNGNIAPDQYEFPCATESFDFAFATSVFTHMRLSEITHYLGEIRRSLRPGGRAMLSFFIIDKTNRQLLSEGNASLDFRPWTDGAYTIDPGTPERAIAYTEDIVLNLFSAAGFHIDQPILYGSWSGRPSMLDGQDIVIVKKSESVSSQKREPNGIGLPIAEEPSHSTVRTDRVHGE